MAAEGSSSGERATVRCVDDAKGDLETLLASEVFDPLREVVVKYRCARGAAWRALGIRRAGCACMPVVGTHGAWLRTLN